MTRSPQLRRIKFINALFAPVTGGDLYLAEQIDAAIARRLDQPAPRNPHDPAYLAAAARVFAQICAGQRNHGCFLWDAGTSDDEGSAPLFVRAKLMQGLKQLAPYANATLIVTNLRRAHCPPNRRWTARRRRDYDESLTFIRELAAARSRANARLNLILL